MITRMIRDIFETLMADLHDKAKTVDPHNLSQAPKIAAPYSRLIAATKSVPERKTKICNKNIYLIIGRNLQSHLMWLLEMLSIRKANILRHELDVSQEGDECR